MSGGVTNYYTKAIAEALVRVRPGDEAWFYCYEHVRGAIGLPVSETNPAVEVQRTLRRVIVDGSGTHWIDTTVPMRLLDYQGTVGALGAPCPPPDEKDMVLALAWLCNEHRMHTLHGHD